MPRLVLFAALAAALPAALAAHAQPAPRDTLRTASEDTAAFDRCVADLARLDDLSARLDSLTTVDAATDEQRDLLRVGARDHFEEIQELLGDLAERIPDLQVAAARVDSLRAEAGARLGSHLGRQWEVLERLETRVREMWGEHTGLAESERVAFETRLDAEMQLVHLVMGWLLDTIALADDLAHDPTPLPAEIDARLVAQAETLADRVRLSVQERERAQDQVTVAKAAGSADSEVAALRLKLRIAEQRLQANVDALRRAVRFLERRDLEPSVYRQVLVEATGEISEQLLDPDVLRGLAALAWRNFVVWLRDNAPGLLVRGLILLGFVFLFRGLARLIWMLNRLTRFQRSSRLLRDLVGRMLLPTSTLLGLFAGLWFLGVDPRTLLAGVGVASIILGLALQDSLGNLAAGAFILLYRPYDVDDTVRAAGELGQVKAMGLANTTIVTFDNRRLFVPNRKIWSEVIENRTMETRRRVDTTVRIGYGEDLDRVFAAIREALADSELVLADPEPLIFVSELHDSWIEIQVRPWAAVEDWWTLTTTLPRLLLETLQAHDITLPHRRQDVNVVSARGTERPS